MAWWRSTLFAVRGYQNFTKTGYERESRKWAATQDSGDAAADKAHWYGCTQRDPHELRVLITGANAGLGRAAAEELAALGATVIMVCRDVGRGQRAVDEIVASTGCARERIRLEIADVSLMGQVRELAARLLAEPAPLHCLVNNAGVLLNEPTTTTEGFDATLMTNLVSGYALTELLLPLLRLAAQAPESSSSSSSSSSTTTTQTEAARARVINVSSGGMYTQHLDVSDMEFAKMKSKPGKWDGVAAYAQTKRQQVSLTEILAEQYRSDGVAVYSCHPGWADTPGVQNSIPGFHERMHDSLRTPLQGADTMVWLAVSDQVDMSTSGEFFEDRRPVQKHLSLSGTASSCTPARYAALLAACRRYSGLDQSAPVAAAVAASSSSPSPERQSHNSSSQSQEEDD